MHSQHGCEIEGCMAAGTTQIYTAKLRGVQWTRPGDRRSRSLGSALLEGLDTSPVRELK